MKELPNTMDRYIYDYDLFENQKELPYCKPTDYEYCESIDFLDISDDLLISKVKSSFLSATLMPNIVQHNRLNNDKDREILRGSLCEKDFKDIHNELIQSGGLKRDILIDLDFLKQRTRKRLIFPETLTTSTELHPMTFIMTENGNGKLMLTKDFIADPLNAINI